MTELEFLNHHQLTRNPFADEDAQTDSVFREFCISGTFHPSWSKVVGDSKQPATAVVFGPKGSGKTAMRLQLVRHITNHNERFPDLRVFLIEFDDFNAYLGPLQEHLPRRHQSSPDKVLSSLRLWDHMDAILSQSVTQLVDQILDSVGSNQVPSMRLPTEKLDRLDRGQRRDLLLLTAAYDRSKTGTLTDRFSAIKKRLRFHSPSTWIPIAVGVLLSLVAVWLAVLLYRSDPLWLKYLVLWVPLGLMAAWSMYAYRWAKRQLQAYRVCKHLRVIQRDRVHLRKLLMQFSDKELNEQPLPDSQRSDDRYALLEKLQLLLRSFGFPGMIVIVDRVDEPDLVNGHADRMKQLVWPLLDNKLLKHENFGIKLLLPSELQYYIDRETREFHERARLDKQNVVASFDWTGEALYDLLAARMKACSNTGASPSPSPQPLFEADVTENRLIAAIQSLRTPRNLFRFMYRLITEHCKRFRSETPQFKISSELFESTLALVQAEDRRQ
ncbi:MAG: hypothetical protein ABL921_30485 [Pirellula sp.]